MNKLLTLLLLALLTTTGHSKNRNWDCLNEDGSVAFTVEAKFVYPFSDGLARIAKQVVIDNTWRTKRGFIDKKGNMAIPCQYDKIKGKGFVNGFAWVKNKSDRHWKLINKKGESIRTNGYEKVGYLFENNGGLCAVYQSGKLGFINMKGEEVIPCKYLGATYFAEGLACVTLYDGKDESYGFMDTKGDMIIPFQFHQAGTASFTKEGYCRATVGGKTVLIDKTGAVVLKTDKGNIQGVSGDWVRVFTKSGRKGWGFINFKSEWMINPTYDKLSDFSEAGYAIATKNGLSGVIDKEETVKIALKYKTVYNEPIEDGYIMGVYPTDEPTNLMNTPKDYFNANFEKIDTKGIKHISPANDGPLMPFVGDNGLHGFLNRDFKIVVSAQYKKSTSFADGLGWAAKD